jgi:hypothetical protein
VGTWNVVVDVVLKIINHLVRPKFLSQIKVNFIMTVMVDKEFGL